MTGDHRLPATATSVAFPVFGLASAAGQRAVDQVCGFRAGRESEIETYGLWLGHLMPDGFGGIRVGSFARDFAYQPGWTPIEVATSAVVDLTLPMGPGSRDRALVDAVCRHARAAVDEHRSWPARCWLVDGTRVTARVWTFAGGWAGWTDELADGHVVAVGVHTSPDDLHLAQVRDGSSYGFDLAMPLDRAHARGSVRDVPETILPSANSIWHADQLALLS